ncbi:MAG: hypothetical protein WCH99_03290 [Verrucomicrobiota bacterium]
MQISIRLIILPQGCEWKRLQQIVTRMTTKTGVGYLAPSQIAAQKAI